jgi:hypothetical protein
MFVVDLKKLEKERIEAEKILLDDFLNGGKFRCVFSKNK